jgi:hypothetical protein
MEKKKTHAAAGAGTAVLERPKTAEKDLTEKVRLTAYSLFEQRGFKHGNDRGDWFEAEKIVRRGSAAG